MRQGGSQAVPPRWILLAALLTLAVVAAASLEDQTGREEGSHVVVGDLKLADDDEGPGDGVQRAFHADNLAPGDERVDTLEILREPIEEHSPTLEPRVRIHIDPSGGSGVFETALRVTELSYGPADLVDDAQAACGRPLTVARLAACTQGEANPLEDLPDPTPEGRSFRLGVLFHPSASDQLEGASYGFDLQVELYGTTTGSEQLRDRVTPELDEPTTACTPADEPDALRLAPSSSHVPAKTVPALPDGAPDPRLGPDGPWADRLWAAWLPADC